MTTYLRIYIYFLLASCDLLWLYHHKKYNNSTNQIQLGPKLPLCSVKGELRLNSGLTCYDLGELSVFWFWFVFCFLKDKMSLKAQLVMQNNSSNIF